MPFTRFGASDKTALVAAVLRSVLGREPGEGELSAHQAGLPPGASPRALVEGVLAGLFPFRAPRFVPPGHHYSPVTPTDEADRQLCRLEVQTLPETLPGIAIDRLDMVALWQTLLPYLAEIPFGPDPHLPLRYRLDNPAYAWGDGSILYAMIRHYRPRRIIEIGSGWSTVCTLDTIDRFQGGSCSVTLIEPFPELARTLIGASGLQPRILPSPVQDVPLETFDELEAGDILFIDSTHVARTGSDVCWELFEILPRLNPGVLVHFHDVFWPFEYPRSWAVDENRSWNEIYALRAFLTGNAGWQILMFNDYLAKLERPLMEATYPNFLWNPGGALWLSKGPSGRVRVS